MTIHTDGPKMTIHVVNVSQMSDVSHDKIARAFM